MSRTRDVILSNNKFEENRIVTSNSEMINDVEKTYKNYEYIFNRLFTIFC